MISQYVMHNNDSHNLGEMCQVERLSMLSNVTLSCVVMHGAIAYLLRLLISNDLIYDFSFSLVMLLFTFPLIFLTLCTKNNNNNNITAVINTKSFNIFYSKFIKLAFGTIS